MRTKTRLTSSMCVWNLCAYETYIHLCRTYVTSKKTIYLNNLNKSSSSSVKSSGVNTWSIVGKLSIQEWSNVDLTYPALGYVVLNVNRHRLVAHS